jgi:hypothetical protein
VVRTGFEESTEVNVHFAEDRGPLSGDKSVEDDFEDFWADSSITLPGEHRAGEFEVAIEN